jgi:hypothetical protein
MSRRERFLFPALGLLVALVGVSSRATAQQAGACASAGAGATIVAAMGIVTNTPELSFGSVVASASAAGTVEQTAAARPSRTGVGVTLGSATTVSAATLSVTGGAGATYAIMLPSDPETIVHENGTDAVTAIVFCSLPDGTGLLNAGSAQTIYVGGAFSVARGQRPGVYSGTFDVTVAYN